jgi:hypothetical protein
MLNVTNIFISRQRCVMKVAVESVKIAFDGLAELMGL